MAKQMERIQKRENRTRSELLREAWRHYFESRYATYSPTPSEIAAIRKGRAAFLKGDYITFDQLRDELDSRRNESRAKKSRKSS